MVVAYRSTKHVKTAKTTPGTSHRSMMMSGHDSWCRWPDGPPCRSFSTDGTRLGADIAHTMGTTSEEEITASSHIPFSSDIQAEQADWDADE